ncbi:sulfur carrier protein ThiS [Microbacterium allomyrinae]|uniref:Sulfur carrier protein ThiS n=1 Tax=Microbacterium allomyrinae TaxID=2830666 RepID=A0A9X1LWB6_9MICO|nr:sulfur carrier protein ThiS [Microbacterium allomyrinae]MCC2032828.1 sulfur carrier protein ThiS [Microbacterium allomyrinae]
MTDITLNGQPHILRRQRSVADLVEGFLGVRIAADGAVSHNAPLGIAVAVNAVVIPRPSWRGHELADGDAVEIVSATQGG